MHLLYPLVLSALLFATGVYGVLARRNLVLVLMSVELMLNAVNLDLVALDAWLRDTLHSGQSTALFVITVAAAEVGVGLAIVLQVFRLCATVAVDDLTDLHDPDARDAALPDAAAPAGGAPAGAAAGGEPAGSTTGSRP
jgi:NADH-quinone oxidoreductase subunit K